MWAQGSGVEFNETTYEELIAVTEIAEVSMQISHGPYKYIR